LRNGEWSLNLKRLSSTWSPMSPWASFRGVCSFEFTLS
jgi:hypothetical protein